jgi:CheY-like chemotaxis protein
MTDKTIMLVEDNPRDEALTLRALKKIGLSGSVIVMRDGAEALDYLFRTGAFVDRRPATLPKVVLMDLNLPTIGGLEALRRIRGSAETRQLPVVILTSSEAESDRLKGFDLGVNSFVRKPVDSDSFARAVQQLGLYWLMLNEPPPPEKADFRGP